MMPVMVTMEKRPEKFGGDADDDAGVDGDGACLAAAATGAAFVPAFTGNSLKRGFGHANPENPSVASSKIRSSLFISV